MKNRRMVSSLVSGAIALLILGGSAKQQRAEAGNVNGGPPGNEWTKAMADQEEHKTFQLTAGAHIEVFNISGDFNISGVVGPVRLDSISGSVNARQLNGGLETVSSVSGNVSVAVEHINNVGLRVSNVSGSIYLGIASDLNAELSISNTSGGVSNRIADLVLDKINASSYSARLGSGGPLIVISNLTGAVVLSRIQKVV